MRLSKDFGHCGCPTTKNKKTLRLKCPKAVPKKQNLGQNINDSKSQVWNSFFENIISGMQRLYIRLHVPVDIIRAFL